MVQSKSSESPQMEHLQKKRNPAHGGGNEGEEGERQKWR